jgi:Uma2 family endonuclease
VSYRVRPPDPLVTIEEFERLPDTAGRIELVRGRVVREPQAGFEHGRLDVDIAYHLRRFVRAHGGGVVVGAETGFVLFDVPPTVRAPDAAFVASERVPDQPVTGFFPGAPDLAVEIVSPSNTAVELLAKVFDYLDAGTRLVWVIYPESRSVAVHASRSEARYLTEADELTGGDVLPGFRLPVAELFEKR